MTARIDHVSVLARDLDEATERFRRLGFDVTPGGPLSNTGIRNALVLLGRQYIELLALDDETRAGHEEFGGPTVVGLAKDRDGTLLGYSVTSAGLDETTGGNWGSRGITGITVDGPFTMRRQLRRGGELVWRMGLPGGAVWRRPWPALIEWQTADDERERLEPAPRHENGVNGISSVAVAVASVETAVMTYRHLLGLEEPAMVDVPDLGAAQATFELGGERIYLLGSKGEGMLADWLGAWGEGLFEVTLASADMGRTRRVLEEAGVAAAESRGWPERLELAPEALYGMRLTIEPARGGTSEGPELAPSVDANTPVG